MTGLRWSRRTTENIAVALSQLGILVSPNTVARLLHEMNYSLRVNHKSIPLNSSPDRNQQFDYIADLRERFRRRRLPAISVDTKKRELIGLFKNSGARWDRHPHKVYDHDFRSASTGVAIPHGVYDLAANQGSITIGVSHDTPAFAVNSIASWWLSVGCFLYSGARQLLILADTGGSNSCRCRAWKTELQSRLVNPFHLKVTVAHYPTGTSKWNPIEHRLFSEISKNWAGEPLDSYQKMLNFIRTTSTKTGLNVLAHLDRRHYSTGLKPTAEQWNSLRLYPHDELPRWNYSIKPKM